MKFLTLIYVGTIFLWSLYHSTATYAQKKLFIRDYTYQASEDDGKTTARKNAMIQMRKILLAEVGEYIQVQRKLNKTESGKKYSEDYSESTLAITAGIVNMKILEEKWNGETFYIKAQMEINYKDIEKRIAAIRKDKQKIQELEATLKRTLEMERIANEAQQKLSDNTRQMADLKKQLETTQKEKNANAQALQQLQKTLTYKGEQLRKAYEKYVNTISAEAYLKKGNSAYSKGAYRRAIRYYKKAFLINPYDDATKVGLNEAQRLLKHKSINKKKYHYNYMAHHMDFSILMGTSVFNITHTTIEGNTRSFKSWGGVYLYY